MRLKSRQPSAGILSGKNQSAGFTSLLVLAGLSVAAGSMLYASTARTRNMINMLQTDRIRNSRDAIVNSLRYTVSIPSILNKSAQLDSSSDLAACMGTTSSEAPCNVLDSTGNPATHELNIFDTNGKRLAGTSANPVSYDAQSGRLCEDPTEAVNCEIQATAFFQISCDSASDCKGKPSASLSIGFKVEQKSTASLPNNMALKPIEVVPSVILSLGAIQSNVGQANAAPGDPNKPYNPIVDPTTAGDITIFDPSTGSKMCNTMKALGNPTIPYDDPTLSTNSPGVTYSNLNTDLHAADENISTISNINGDVWATSKSISTVSDVHAPTQGLSLNAKSIDTISNITAPHSYIVAHTVNTVSNMTGYLYASADTIGLFSNVATNEHFTVVNRGWITSGTSSTSPVLFSNITSGQFLLCGFNVSTLSNVKASYIGLQNSSIQGVSSNVTVDQLTSFGGSIAATSNFTGNMTIYNATVGDLSTINGNITFYNSTIGNLSNVSGTVTFYNSSVGNISNTTGNIYAHGGSITQVTGLNNPYTVNLYAGATLGSHPGVSNTQIVTNP